MTEHPTLTMERTFDAPAERVFDAFTSEEVLARWFHAGHDWETPEATADVRVGGEVRIVMRNPHEDVKYGGRGSYTEIDPPRRLAFTWIWDDDRDQTEQLIEIDFTETDGRDDDALRPPRPLGRGGGREPRGRLDQRVRQPAARGRVRGLALDQLRLDLAALQRAERDQLDRHLGDQRLAQALLDRGAQV